MLSKNKESKRNRQVEIEERMKGWFGIIPAHSNIQIKFD